MKRLIAAATKGDPDAEYNLGVMYDNRIDDHGNAVDPTDDNGNPIDSNRSEAMKWLRRAAEHGQARAQMRLAELYASGPAAARNYGRSCQWFILAMTALDGVHRQRAQNGYRDASAQLTAPEILAARRRAREWEHRRRTAAPASERSPARAAS